MVKYQSVYPVCTFHKLLSWLGDVDFFLSNFVLARSVFPPLAGITRLELVMHNSLEYI